MKLETYMAQHGLTDAEMASRIGVSVPAIHRYRTGQRIPRDKIMVRIAETTKGAVQANDFFGIAASRASDAEAA